MRLMEKHLILDFKELRPVGIQCMHCKATALIDISEKDNKVPMACSCGQPFYRDLDGRSSPFERLVKALKEVSSEHFPHRVTVHIAGAPLEF